METQNKFSVYKAPVRNTTPYKTVNIGDVFTVITSDKYKSLTEQLRKLPDKQSYNEFKESQLDYVSFSGEFKQRSNNGIIQHSNLFCIDLDNLQSVDETRAKIKELFEPHLMFVSPSGKGLKLVYKIDIEQAEHKQYFKAFERFFLDELNIQIDDKCKDVSRACFLCYDNEAHFNKDVEIIDKSFIDTFYTETEKVQQIDYKTAINQPLSDYSIIMERVKTWLNKNESYINGNRHGYLTKLTGAYNRYGIPQTLAESDVLSFCESDCKQSDLLNIVKGIYKNTEWHNTAKFEINTPYEFTVNEVVEVKELEKTPLLPIENLPVFIQEFINEYVEVYNVPRDYIAASVLFSTALAIGNKLELKTKYDNIPLLWLAIVGNVSSGKTEPLKTCLSYFTNKDNAAFKDYQINLSNYNAYIELSKKDKANTEPVEQPRYFQYLLNDYTPEALYNVHTINNRGLCIYRDELKGWLDDFGRYSKSGEQSTMLSTFYRQAMQINRASKEPIFIDKPCIYISGGIQPDILPDLAKENRAENGFLSRFMFAYPDIANKQPYSKNKLNTDTLLNYHKYLSVLDNLTNIVDLELSNEAETIYSNWYNDNAEKTNNEPTGYLKGVYGKLDVIVLRLAIVVHGMNIVCNKNTSREISATNMQTAIQLIEYFRATALKVYHKIFKDTGKANLNKKEVIKYLSSVGASQNEIAAPLKISQQYVNKVLNNR